MFRSLLNLLWLVLRSNLSFSKLRLSLDYSYDQAAKIEIYTTAKYGWMMYLKGGFGTIDIDDWSFSLPENGYQTKIALQILINKEVFNKCTDPTCCGKINLSFDPLNCNVPIPMSCDWYLSCLEKSHECGPDGYAQSFGYFYCSKYLSNLSVFSPKAKNWIKLVLLCLQNALVPLQTLPGVTCDAIKTTAFDSHPACYTQPAQSVCDLPNSDWGNIYLIVWKGLRSSQVVWNSFLTANICLTNWTIKLIIEPLKEIYSSIQEIIGLYSSVSISRILILDLVLGKKRYLTINTTNNPQYFNVTFTIMDEVNNSINPSINSTTALNNFNKNSKIENTYWKSIQSSYCDRNNASLCYVSPVPFSAVNTGMNSLAKSVSIFKLLLLLIVISIF